MSPGSIIRAFIEEQYPYPGKQIAENEDLFVSGVLDSISFTGLLIFLKKKFAVTFDQSELTLENFASIATISERVEGKLQSRRDA
jgi:acyl carrier protein